MSRVYSLLIAMLFAAGCTQEAQESTGPEAIMEKARALAPDLDTPEKARAAGYEPDRFCIPGMGVHWIHQGGRPGSHMDTTIDLDKPEVVLFLPDTADMTDTAGDRFLGIEYVVLTEGTPMNTTATVPSIHGVKLVGPMEGHGPGMPWHAELHVYLAEGLESGPDFAESNSGIVCPEGTTPPAP